VAEEFGGTGAIGVAWVGDVGEAELALFIDDEGGGAGEVGAELQLIDGAEVQVEENR
jgi:hypothetical protein